MISTTCSVAKIKLIRQLMGSQSSTQLPPKRLRLVSYNIDFQSPHLTERTQNILFEIRKTNCDIVALQEVNTSCVTRIINDMKDIYPYHITSFQRRFLNRNYVELILSRIPFESSTCFNYEETLMDRSLLWGVINYNGKYLTIATTHLESLEANSKFRNLQANVIHDKLGSSPNVILVGDINTEQELSSLSTQWKELPHNNSTWFLQRLDPTKPNISKRYDRAFINSNWSLPTTPEISAQLVSEYLPQKVWSSDHDGLIITI